jgi:hypothetical protein
LVGADLRTKTVGSSSFGTPISTAFNGANATDFAFQGGPTAKGFPAFAPILINPFTVFWVHAFISITAGSAALQDCRYNGVFFTYTVDRP